MEAKQLTNRQLTCIKSQANVQEKCKVNTKIFIE